MNGLLIQCASPTHIPLLDVTEPHHRAYTERWGLDFVCRRGEQQNERSAYWDRLYLLLLALRQGRHEFIAVLDADCLIQAVEWDMRTSLPPGAWLGMTAYPPGEGRYPKSTVPYLHSGVMLVRRSPEALAFFEEVWRQGEGVDDENTALLRLLQQQAETWRGGIAVLPLALHTPAGSPQAPEAAIVGWHGQGSPQERATAIAAGLGQGAPRPSSRPIWIAANPVPNDPPTEVNFKTLLGRVLAVNGELPPPAWEKVGRAALDIRPTTAKSKTSDVQVIPMGGQEKAELRPEYGKPLLVYPWSTYLAQGLTTAFGAAQEIWAASRFERDTYVHLGIPAEKIQVVTPGVDTTTFSPIGSKLTIPTGRKRRLLLTGPLTPDSGADIALAAYRRAFTRTDDVCLVVHTSRQAPLYGLFAQAESDASFPEIFLLDDELDESGRAAQYRSCHAVLSPARRLPDLSLVLEAMACSLPAVACCGSPLDDLVDDNSAFRVPMRWFTEGERYFQEADIATLIEALQSVVYQPEQATRFGEVARAQVESFATTAHWRSRIRARLARLVESSMGGSKEATLWAEPTQPGPSSAKASRSRKKAPVPKIALSLCMIARDEEERIGACLASIKPFVDEMIVVDTGSKDRTREIALEHGARVFEFPWVNSFAEARNQSLAQARGEWIFWMDADDVIPEDCGKRLKELIALHPNRDAAYHVQVRIPPGEGEYTETVVDHVKLFPNDPDIRFEFRIHEQVMPALRRKGLSILPSDVYVVHKHYDRSTGGQQKKRLRDFQLLELDLKEKPDHPFVLFNLGMTHLYATKDYQIAAQYLERCLAGSHPKDSIVSKAYALLTTCRVCQRRWHEALAACEAGRQHYPDDPELMYRAGQIYQELGEFEKARLTLEHLVGGGDSPGEMSRIRNGVIGFSSYLGMFELAQANLALRRQDRAEALLRRILRDYPDFGPASELLSKLTGETSGPVRETWPACPRIAVYYHAFLQGDWETLVKEQMNRLVSSGLHARADRLVTGVVGNDTQVKRFQKLLPKGRTKWEVLGTSVDGDEAKGELRTLKRLHHDGQARLYDTAWYFHTKGITRNAPGAIAWRHYMEHFLLDRWEDGFQALHEGWDTYGVEWKLPTPDGPWYHYSGNFWAARGDYLRCLSPIAYVNRFSCEDWIGHGNARAWCAHRSGVNLYETVYPEESYRINQP